MLLPDNAGTGPLPEYLCNSTAISSSGKDYIFVDVECYRNVFGIVFRRLRDGKVVIFEQSHRSTIDWERVRRLLLRNTIVTFNGNVYDVPMCWLGISGATCSQLKDASDRIIKERIKPWKVEHELGIRIPHMDHIDCFENNPSVGKSLKLLNGRLHGRRMQDLPYDPDKILTDDEIDKLMDYCANADIPATALLFYRLQEPIKLREAIGKIIGMDVRSKSDAQIGEAIVKKRVEEITGRKIKRLSEHPTEFKYEVPDWLRFDTPQLQAVLDTVRETTFRMGKSDKVEFPKEFEQIKIKIGSTDYKLGIGGLHSKESCRALESNDEYILVDADVASQYPSIISKLGLYPKAVGPVFLDVYRGIISDRLAAKKAKDKVRDQSGKIALNGVYGKLGSYYSFLFAPHLMLAVTLTGQLSLLMLVERCEANGIEVVSGNTDGVVFRLKRSEHEGVDGVRLIGGKLKEITDWWEETTSFMLEFAEYRGFYNASVNEYLAIKADGKVKYKGKNFANPWAENDYYNIMKKNPTMTICSEAVGKFLLDGTPVEETIRASRDITKFVSVINVTGGGTWRSEYLGKVVRYIWAHDGEEILYKKPNEKTGNFKKVQLTDGCRPMMDFEDGWPDDLDYQRYIDNAYKILRNVGWREQKALLEHFCDFIIN